MNFTTKDRKEPKKKMTDEELLAFRKAKAEERDKDRKVAEALEPRLPKMSHRQLRGELKRVIRGEKVGKKEYRSGLRISFASVLLTVLDNTRTSEKMKRLDQINPTGRMHPYPL